jgi:hypothetical protein
MAMAIVRHFDRLHSTPNTADVAAAGQLLEPIFAELGRFAEWVVMERPLTIS